MIISIKVPGHRLKPKEIRRMLATFGKIGSLVTTPVGNAYVELRDRSQAIRALKHLREQLINGVKVEAEKAQRPLPDCLGLTGHGLVRLM